MDKNWTRSDLEAAIRVIETLRGHDLDSLATQIRDRSHAIEAQISPLYDAFLHAHRDTKNSLDVLMKRLEPHIGDPGDVLKLYQLCIDLGLQILRIEIDVAEAIGGIYLPLQRWVGSGSA